MIRLSFITLALLLMLMAGCAYRQSEAVRTESQRTETTRTHEGNDTAPGGSSQQTETTRTHHESSTTR